MTAAPKRGGGEKIQRKREPSRLAPEGSENKSINCCAVDSSPTTQIQEAIRVERKPPPWILIPARKRRQQISSLLRYRHSGPCLTDDAEMWFEEVAIHLVISCRAKALQFVVDEWVRLYTPRLAADRVTAILERVQVSRPFYRSADIGLRLRLTSVVKELLGITHIAAFDVDPVVAAERKKASERERVNAHRLATGKVKKPRAQSISQLVPRFVGESNAAFYKRAKPLAAAMGA